MYAMMTMMTMPMMYDQGSIRESIASMRRFIRRDFDLPPDKLRTGDEFFARMDALNDAGRLTQETLDEEFIALMIATASRPTRDRRGLNYEL